VNLVVLLIISEEESLSRECLERFMRNNGSDFKTVSLTEEIEAEVILRVLVRL